MTESNVSVLDKYLVDGWRAAWKMYSIWFYALLALTPDLYNLAISMEVFAGDEAPKTLARIINTIGFLGAVFRLVKQKTVEIAAQQATEQRTGQ